MESIFASSPSTPETAPAFPTPILIRAATLLDDPLICDWALRYLEHPSRTGDEKQLLADLWFSPGQLQRLFYANDKITLLRLLQVLPPEQFLPLTSNLMKCWQGSITDLCLAAASALSRADPVLAAQVFEAHLDSDGPKHIEIFMSIATHLQYLPASNQVALLEKMVVRKAPESNSKAHKIWQRWQSDIHRGFFKVALRQQHAVLAEIFCRMLVQSQANVPANGYEEVHATIEWLATEMFGHVSWARLCIAHCDWADSSVFQDFDAILESTAPIAEMDQILQTGSMRDGAVAALDLLQRHHARLPAASTCWQLLNECDIESAPLAIKSLALAAVAAAFECKTLNTEDATLAQLTALLAQDIEVNQLYAALTQQIRAFPKAAIVAAISEQFEQNVDDFGRLALLRFIGELGWSEFNPLLLDALIWDEFFDETDDLFCEAVTEAFMQVDAAAHAVMQNWDTLDFNQQFWGVNVLLRQVGAAELVSFLLTKLDTMLGEDGDLWYELALMTPDPRLLEHLKLDSPRYNWLVEHCFYCTCRLLDIAHPKLEAMQKNVLMEMRYERSRPDMSSLPALLPWQQPAQLVTRPVQVINEDKVGRNDPCPCGSGKKYKKCCMQ